jgi:hypothetical protein
VGVGRPAARITAFDPSAEAEEVEQRLGPIDVLVLNASGGMESGMGEDYAMRLNRDAQVNVVRERSLHARFARSAPTGIGGVWLSKIFLPARNVGRPHASTSPASASSPARRIPATDAPLRTFIRSLGHDVFGWGGEVAERYIRFVFSAEPVQRLEEIPERLAGGKLAAAVSALT